MKRLNIVLNFLILLMLFFYTCSNEKNVIPPGNMTFVEVISPTKVKSGDYIPIVIKILINADKINTDISEKYQLKISNGTLDKCLFNVKKGMGCVTTRVEANENFNISIENDCCGKDYTFSESIPAKFYGGTIDTSIEIWNNDYDYYITEDLTVSENTEWIIKEGTRVFIDNKVNIFINGILNIQGTKSNPVLFISKQWNLPWGGIEINNSSAYVQYCFFVNGGADDSKIFGHSNSQPVFKANQSELNFINCYFFDNVGKALGSYYSKVKLDSCLISRCDTGGEFQCSLVNVFNSYVLDIPNDDGVFVDDDNDGFYFSSHFPNVNEASRVENCFIITGKDDAIDHNKAKLEINNCWLEDFMHEGVAGSNGNWVKVFNTLVKNCQQGIEAGYRIPSVYVDHCVVVDNEIGLRFGDSYSWGCNGKMTVTNTIIYNNGDNIYNFDLKTQAPVDSGIVISYSMTNDPEYDNWPFCITGVPEFDKDYFLLPDSPGKGLANDGTDMGRIN